MCPRITVDGKNVHIEAKLEFGFDAAPADMTMVRDAIKYWGRGKMFGYNVTMDLNVADAPTIEVFLSKKQLTVGAVGGLGTSFGRNKGGQMEVLTGSGRSAASIIAGHEFGHVMGLKDGPQGTNDLMSGNYALGTSFKKVTKTEFEDAIKNCRVDAPDPSKTEDKP